MIVVQWEAQQTQNSKLRSALREMEARADSAEETSKLAGWVGGSVLGCLLGPNTCWMLSTDRWRLDGILQTKW